MLSNTSLHIRVKAKFRYAIVIFPLRERRELARSARQVQ
jgi:hypothetical protein